MIAKALTRRSMLGGGPLLAALNEIPVVFAGGKDVETALGKFHEATDEGFRAEHFVPLAQAMAKSAEVPHEDWDRDLIEHPFTPGPGSMSK